MPRPKNRNAKWAQNIKDHQNIHRNVGTSPIPQQKKDIGTEKKDFIDFNMKTLVFSTLASGFSFISAFTFLALLTGYIIDKKNFYKTQKELEIIINNELLKQLKQNQELQTNTIVGFDGAWNHVRGGSCCIVTMVDIKTKKIIDIAIIEKTKQYVKGNSDLSSKSLEAEGIKKLSQKWKNDKRIIGYVHDNDGTTRKIFKENRWNIIEYLDYGHSIKAVSRLVKNFVSKNEEFKEIEISLEKWLISILKSNDNQNIKLDLWLNSYNHYKNVHTNCKHSKNKVLKNYTFSDKSIEKLKKFLKRTSNYGAKVNNLITSQAVESFNAFKSHFAQKSLKFASSTKLRYQIAALTWNDRTWPFDFVQNNLCADNMNEYVKIIYKNLVEPNCKKYRCTKELKNFKNKKRNEQRYKQKQNKDPYAYKGKKKGLKELFT